MAAAGAAAYAREVPDSRDLGEDDGIDPAHLRYHVDHRSIPQDAQRLGLDRNTQEGAMLSFAASLDPRRRAHKVVAWVMLLALVVPGPLSVGWPLVEQVQDFFTW